MATQVSSPDRPAARSDRLATPSSDGREAPRDRRLESALALAAVPLAALAVATYWDTLRQLVAVWDKDPSYSHGYLVPLASVAFGVLAWQRGGPDLQQVRSGRGIVGGAAEIVLGGVLHAAAWLLSLLLLDVVALICTIRGVLLLAFGPSVNQKLGFAALFLIFMAPLPPNVYQAAALAMQHFVSVVSTECLDLLGIAAYRQGYMIHLANLPNPLEVGEACSGLRGLTALLALGVAMGELYQNSRPVRWLLAIGALPVAVVANCVRVVLSAIIIKFFGRKWGEGAYHVTEGMAVLFLAAVGLMLLGYWLGRLEQRWGWKSK